MNSLCIFCGSSRGSDPVYMETARRVGNALGTRGITLVYGGGSLGLMGASAKAAMDAGGKAIGIIPKLLSDREVEYRGLTELHIVDTMHERKALMTKLSDGFLILPGGIGTMEEFFEVWSWVQLGIHNKPFGVLEVNGYWTDLLKFIDKMVSQGFVHQKHRELVHVSGDLDALLRTLSDAAEKQIPAYDKFKSV